MYYIASLKHTHSGHEHITWWGRMYLGYTPVVGDYCGEYVYGYAVDLNDGYSHIAVPVDAVDKLISPEPYYKLAANDITRRFYDQRGPVVENTRANWTALIAASLTHGRMYKPKPEVFNGKRRAIVTE